MKITSIEWVRQPDDGDGIVKHAFWVSVDTEDPTPGAINGQNYWMPDWMDDTVLEAIGEPTGSQRRSIEKIAESWLRHNFDTHPDNSNRNIKFDTHIAHQFRVPPHPHPNAPQLRAIPRPRGVFF